VSAPARAETEASRTTLWAGRALSALPVLFLLFDSAVKFTGIPPVVESFARLGYPADIGPLIGALEMAGTVLYLVPRTSALGAILLTGFLGGATATHLRVGDPVCTHVLLPFYVGLFLWAGLFFRDARLRALVPRRTSAA
jgi:hypothetical protein